MKECDVFIEYMQPIINLGIQLIILEGNHEVAIEKYYGFSPYDYICKQLDAIQGGQSAFIRVDNDGIEYDLFVQHGTGGGGTLVGSGLNKIQKLSNPIECDLYTMGHIHKMNISMERSVGFDTRRDTWIGTSGCFLDSITEGHRGYFSNKMTSMSHLGYLVYSMSNKKKHSYLSAVYL
jgi:hypothetical protein